MSGHSKWAKIRHKKGINDAKKGKIFSKYAQQITIAARDGGGDPDTNFSLRLLVDKAKAESMPSDNIQRAIDRGTGKGSEGAVILHNATYEGQGPGGVSVIVETVTDNTNRTIADMRKAFSSKGGALGENGSVTWNFKRRGLVSVQVAKKEASEKFGEDDKIVPLEKEETMLDIMDIEGIQDIEDYENSDNDDTKLNGLYFDVFTDPKQLGSVRDSINEKGILIRSAELIWQANDKKDVDNETLEKVESFVEEVDDLDDVQSVWTDVDDKLN